jgi:hypothetical protein
MRYILLAVLLSSCASVPATEVPWVTSSMDSNQGRVHRVVLKDEEPQSVVKRIAAIAEKRDVIIVFSACKGDSCDFSMKRKAETRSSADAGGYVGRKWVSFANSTTNATFGSQFFGRAMKTDSGTSLEMLGAPTMNEMVGCPTTLEKLRRCKRASVGIRNSESVTEVASAQFGVDLSGHVEAEIISGIFTELQLQQ